MNDAQATDAAPTIDGILLGIVVYAENQIALVDDLLALRSEADEDFSTLIQIRKDMQKLIHDQLWTQDLYNTGRI